MKQFVARKNNYTQRLASHHTDYERSCLLKRVFRDHPSALKHCGYMGRTYGLAVRPYKCRYCEGYHTTTVKTTQTEVPSES